MPLEPRLVAPHLRHLHGYTPGIQPTDSGWIKLNTNECAHPPSPRVVEAIRREVGGDGAALRLYPNPTSAPLRQAIADHHGGGLTAANVLVGNGSDEVLNLLVRCFGGPGHSTGFTLPSYSLYPVLVAIHDGETRTIPFDRTLQLPVERIASSGARAFFLTSPNAPTGVGFANREIEEVMRRFDGLLVVDEAYAPFARENAAGLVAGHDRLVVVRTFSKAFALAGIRVGYLLASAEVVELLDRVRDSYNVNRLSQAAALAALGDGEYYAAMIARIRDLRDRCFREWTGKWGWFVYPSEANFLFVEPRNRKGATGAEVARSLYEFLLARRVLVRAFPNHPLTASFLRITVGTEAEMAAVTQSLLEWQTFAP
jgi:histidinol-phosphate aminotransferase